jgi:hypothetical protein
MNFHIFDWFKLGAIESQYKFLTCTTPFYCLAVGLSVIVPSTVVAATLKVTKTLHVCEVINHLEFAIFFPTQEFCSTSTSTYLHFFPSKIINIYLGMKLFQNKLNIFITWFMFNNQAVINTSHQNILNTMILVIFVFIEF